MNTAKNTPITPVKESPMWRVSAAAVEDVLDGDELPVNNYKVSDVLYTEENTNRQYLS